MGEESRSRQTGPLIGYFRHRRRLVATNQRVRRNLPRFPDLVNHLDRERAPTRKNLGRTRARAQTFCQPGLGMAELVDGVPTWPSCFDDYFWSLSCSTDTGTQLVPTASIQVP
jgi:hypothetical protein